MVLRCPSLNHIREDLYKDLEESNPDLAQFYKNKLMDMDTWLGALPNPIVLSPTNKEQRNSVFYCQYKVASSLQKIYRTRNKLLFDPARSPPANQCLPLPPFPPPPPLLPTLPISHPLPSLKILIQQYQQSLHQCHPLDATKLELSLNLKHAPLMPTQDTPRPLLTTAQDKPACTEPPALITVMTTSLVSHASTLLLASPPLSNLYLSPIY
ncbi:hypothetical protein QOT17_023823 [Balamuthia mandrillaris]